MTITVANDQQAFVFAALCHCGCGNELGVDFPRGRGRPRRYLNRSHAEKHRRALRRNGMKVSSVGPVGPAIMGDQIELFEEIRIAEELRSFTLREERSDG